MHLPFCKQKCNYCDFVSYAGKEDLIDEYVDALCEEIKTSPLSSDFVGIHSPLHQRWRGVDAEGGRGEARTVYFGGGTPTLLEPRHFEQILKPLLSLPAAKTSSPYKGEELFSGHSFSPLPRGRCRAEGEAEGVEITIEANPATADKTKLKELRSLGISRLSIGAQSFNDKHLKVLGRIHNSKDIFKFYEDARSAGFDNINLDLIFALPNQTLTEWQKDLETALSLNPEHLSTYNLQIEENTPLKTTLTAHASHLTPANEELDLAMYEYTIEALTANGYKHYEISNFAKPGLECKHNIVYWKNENYVGLGAGAHSHVDGKRWSNPYCLEKYLSLPPGPSHFMLHTSHPDQRETIFMGLRLLDGIAKEHFAGFEKEVEELTKVGLLELSGPNIKLTRKGLYLANEVFLYFV
ncbi:MAG: radical SAM family heme chaperone HemW [bacterium]